MLSRKYILKSMEDRRVYGNGEYCFSPDKRGESPIVDMPPAIPAQRNETTDQVKMLITGHTLDAKGHFRLRKYETQEEKDNDPNGVKPN